MSSSVSRRPEVVPAGATSPRSGAAAAATAEPPRRRPDGARVYVAIAAAVALAWLLGQTPFFDPRTDTGYWVGVAGGAMMVLLFAYPLRKRLRWLASLGKTRHWFVWHMVLGVAGPVIILAHSSFRIGSLNAGVALVSMLVVAFSGVIGRFIYLHTHRGLGGERETLQALQAKLGLADSSSQGGLRFAPRALDLLHRLQAHAGQPGDRWGEHLARLFVLPLRLVAARRAVRREIAVGLGQRAAAEHWPREKQARRLDKAARLADEHLDAVLRVAQFAAYARIFSLWHLLHVPFVFMMVACAIVHVVAVHAY